MELRLLTERVSCEKRLYESSGLFTAPVPLGPLMTIRIVDSPWRAVLVAPLTLEQWKKWKSKNGHSLAHNFGESETNYKARVLIAYSKYLHSKYGRASACVRAFMKASKPKEVKNAKVSSKRRKKGVSVVGGGMSQPERESRGQVAVLERERETNP
jgi:hypothetical protein